MRRVTAVLGIRRRIKGEADEYGNPRVSYGDPEEWPVYAVQPRQSDEPDADNRDAVSTGITVLAPLHGPRPGPLDLVVHDGELWDVTGDVGTWQHNPHVATTKQAGIVVNLDRTEG